VSLAETSIKRPVLATVMSLVIVLFGITGFTFLGVREYPAVDPPIVTIQTTYPGANPQVIASQITEPLEAGDQRHRRHPHDGLGIPRGAQTITVEFTLDTDLDAAANDVRDRVARATRNLPVDSNPPVVEKADADSSPILFLSMRSDTRDILEVSDLADRLVRERMETIPGVSSVRIFGEKRYAMRLWMDPVKLAVHRVTPIDVQAALDAQNVDLPSGRLEGGTTELSLRTLGRLNTPEDFENLIVKEEAGRQIHFRDIGHAELGPGKPPHRNQAKAALLHRRRHHPAAEHQRDRHRRRVLQTARDREEGSPRRRQRRVGYDFTRFVRRSVEEVKETLVIAFCWCADHLPVPARLALDAHPGDRHPGEHRLRLLHHVSRRLLDQRADAGRHRAGHRPGLRRRHRGAGEHLLQDRGRHAAA
jgi:multidrug efflux pump